MKTILFICQANVGRSQMAEGFFNACTKDAQAISAGVLDMKQKYQNHPARQIIEIMQEEGIDISRQKVKVVTKEMVDKADKVVVLCKKEECPDFVVESAHVDYLSIEDPSSMFGDDLRHIRDEIKHLVLRLVSEFP